MAHHNLTIYRNLGDQVLSGKKDLEVRVGYRGIKRIKPDDSIRFFNTEQSITVRAVKVRRYSSFRQMLDHEDHHRIAPEVEEEVLLKRLQALYPPDRERLGVYVIEFAKSK